MQPNIVVNDNYPGAGHDIQSRHVNAVGSGQPQVSPPCIIPTKVGSRWPRSSELDSQAPATSTTMALSSSP